MIATKHRLLIGNLGSVSLCSTFSLRNKAVLIESVQLLIRIVLIHPLCELREECLALHTKCFDVQSIAATRRILPPTLLDLAPALDANFIRLQSSESLSIQKVYVTLSHCWGGYIKITLTSSSLPTFQAGIHLSTLPRTFRHAVVLTRKLGIRYL